MSRKKLKINIQMLHPDAVIPKYAKPGDAGLDLTAISKEYLEQFNCWKYGFGLSMEISPGHVGLIFPRSSVFKKDLDLSNCVGVIDSDYRGEISALFRELDTSHKTYPEQYDIGDRVAQIIIMPYPEVEFEVVDNLSETERGTSGFGSSGN